LTILSRPIFQPGTPRRYQRKYVQPAQFYNSPIEDDGLKFDLARLRLSGSSLALFFCISLCFSSFVYFYPSYADVWSQKLRTSMQTRFGSEGEARLDSWLALLVHAADLPEKEQLKQINDFFNQTLYYREDIDQWQQRDYWATPLESLGTSVADCEDYTIAKYATLIKLGVPVDRLRLIYVRAQIGGPHSRVSQAHMVLGYYESPGAMPLILDNLIGRIQLATDRPDLKPVFSFNSQGLWVGNNQHSQADPTARLSRWRDLLARMQAEGFYD
jgi:predicted transglutaminase-like cysteine proteinase